MRFLHIADLHLGKSIYGASLIENGDQPHWVERFIEKAGELKVDAVVIAGDVYDRSAPSGDAVTLLSKLLTGLADLNIPVLLTAGNHDSAERLAFVAPLLARQNLYISRPLMESPELAHVTIAGVTFWLMPYVFPDLVRDALKLEERPGSYDAAVRALLARQDVDFSQPNVLIAHQNVTANGKEGDHTKSESMVGGLGQVDFTAFDGFEYVALGHIHSSYSVGREGVRYAGTPMCYSFDELRQPDKGALLVELNEKGAPPTITPVVIPPLHPMRALKGTYRELQDAALAETRRGEYLSIVLTDRRNDSETHTSFKNVYEKLDSRVMHHDSEYREFRSAASGLTHADVREKPVEALFADFFEERCEAALDESDVRLLEFAGELSRHADDLQDPPTQTEIDKLLNMLKKQEANA